MPGQAYSQDEVSAILAVRKPNIRGCHPENRVEAHCVHILFNILGSAIQGEYAILRCLQVTKDLFCLIE